MKSISDAIDFFGGTLHDPTLYKKSFEGFDAFRSESGVKHFASREILDPNKRELAARLGFYLFLPIDQSDWPGLIALALCADKIREHLGESVTGRNWYRPSPYNKAVGGAPKSDHLQFPFAVDLDYRSVESRKKAESWLIELDEKEKWLSLSIGLGEQFHHIGIMSKVGRRGWTYGDRDKDPDAINFISVLNRPPA